MTTSEGVSVARAIEFLNEVVRLDRRALTSLIEARVPCNEELAEHPTVQVARADGVSLVGIFGVLNGLFGVRADGYGHITAIYDDAGIIERFEDTSSSRG